MDLFWPDKFTKELLETKGKKDHVISSMITPSGPIHLGNLRGEILTAWAIYKSLKDKGIKAKFIFIADNFDHLRTLYPFLPKKFEKYIGQPLSEIPDPFGCHKSYDKHFLAPFFDALKILKIEPEIFYADKLYKEGVYTEVIKTALSNTLKIKEIIQEVTHAKLPSNWSPFVPICSKCGKLTDTEVLFTDLEANLVTYRCKCGNKGIADFSKGEGKLRWRIHWPAGWKVFKITIEPFGKDHATPGGSYDTGKRIAKEVFGIEPPFPIACEWVYLKGKGAMAGSTGVVLTPIEALKFLKPEILKYILLRPDISRHIELDLGLGILDQIDDFIELEKAYLKSKGKCDFARAYEFSLIEKRRKKILPHIPSRHFINTVQSAAGNLKEIKRILRKTGYGKELKNEKLLKEQISKFLNWIENYAPSDLKFEVQKELPQKAKKLKSKQKEFLKELAKLIKEKQWKPEDLHNEIYKLIKKMDLTPKEGFQAIYLVILGRISGPKAGWFLSILDKDFLIKRFKQASRGENNGD